MLFSIGQYIHLEISEVIFIPNYTEVLLLLLLLSRFNRVRLCVTPETAAPFVFSIYDLRALHCYQSLA